MAIIYTITIHNPNTSAESPIPNWPPQMYDSSWYTELCDKSFSVTDTLAVIRTKSSIRMLWFGDIESFESWTNSNRLTDAGLVSALSEWHTTNNITLTENYYEAPTYTPSISGLIG